MDQVPDERVRDCNGAPVRADGSYVLYWMTAFRRTRWNFSLQRAVELSRELGQPLLVLEALRCGYPWASDRLHRFVMEGMRDNARQLDGSTVRYYAYLEDARGAGSGLLEALASRAAAVVTDDYPAFFLPRMVAAAGERLDVRLEKVDSNGLIPIRSVEKVYESAYAFRRYIQKHLRPYLSSFPAPYPLLGGLPGQAEVPAEVSKRWPDATPQLLDDSIDTSSFPIDHDVAPVEISGGADAADAALRRFLDSRLSDYGELRNHPDERVTSELSPYLHFGHIASHQVFSELMETEEWDVDGLSDDASGKRSGWWGVGESAEGFLDQLVTWRELGFNMCVGREDYDSYGSLPDWARETLEEHEKDEREHIYSLPEFAEARTHDEVWNAAQNQLLREGQLHNYMRMVWGKKILEWSPSPRDALEVMIELNNRYALDGRDPNSYSGIFWCLGRYDRPWGPERPIFGKVRYMSSENTVRKLRVSEYLEKYAP
ncbi:MAG: deoxyribodipyrimidine photolyase [Gemmatimonadetes bacterium]|uniref:Deoxyribodipyrimidine photo-lyase n=1 Tax=Candidatus Kutchimonas denitrificans TaxID=3056748 RepID=A0AAE4Z622_9BACT|nr:deoxyribodipyrimidine photolyase [Gemmatimonadota bacterium]NIR74424.1 deoxyribodipyrimidine photolyase [Candidatus Kutchimonas denitrificans]NIS00820.1 deoxyribodipyrimidine photolyase [Gemmatimonadota bacterium]NIT66443.1 deoxyribodipyrimidine photolyase [Gemmatimonadota bacterium]NIU52074.1 deoxyribodipyrimidine photolyase [Gemmatimonadota bacterium]